MRLIRPILITVSCLFVSANLAADSVPGVAEQNQTLAETVANPDSTPAQDQAEFITLKQKLYDDLKAGSVSADLYDPKIEADIANTEIALAKYYLDSGDRKNAAIYAVMARRTLQRLYGRPDDPRLIPVYSMLVQIYESDVDSDAPGQSMADANQAKFYREMIDHIHAE